MADNNNAKLLNLGPFLQAGINPKTGLPIKFSENDNNWLETAMNINMRIIDEQNAVNKYHWINLPDGLNGQMVERILYYRAQGIIFRLLVDNRYKFFFLPYTLNGGIDQYGRFKNVSPLTFGGGVADDNGKAKNDKEFLPNKVFKVYYDILPEDVTPDELTKAMDEGCVILRDYTEQLSQISKSRQILNDPLCKAIAECFPFARTSLIAHSGVRGMRVANENDAAQAALASQNIEQASKNGQTMIPFVSRTEIQDFSQSSASKTEDYLLYMQSLENIRLGTHGLTNGGIFEKKERKLVSEQSMNSSNVSYVYNDGLTNRQRFCDIVNSIWGLGIWCEPSENEVGDLDMDGYIADDNGEEQYSMDIGGENYDE